MLCYRRKYIVWGLCSILFHYYLYLFHFLSSGSRMSKNDFMILAILGKGGFGEVYLSRKRDTGEVLVLLFTPSSYTPLLLTSLLECFSALYLLLGSRSDISTPFSHSSTSTRTLKMSLDIQIKFTPFSINNEQIWVYILGTGVKKDAQDRIHRTEWLTEVETRARSDASDWISLAH